ncbi:MAG: TraR/DksA C4-type zinc finger protein [Limnochordales bacterium]|nr:TraR/DksA C4-type zinc finger protein [Limnochordales bacterium]
MAHHRGTDDILPADPEDIRTYLRAEAERLRERVQGMNDRQLGEPLLSSVGELSAYDNHTSDLATETFEREKDVTLRLQARHMLELIERALQKLDAGTYGICDRCGRPIGRERLAARPYAVFCYTCQVAEEKAHDTIHGVQEEPFQWGYVVRDGEGYTGYDGEDAWQDVARYGNANSPQDIPEAVEHGELSDTDEDTGAVEPVDAVVDLAATGVTDPELIYPEPAKGGGHHPQQ